MYVPFILWFDVCVSICYVTFIIICYCISDSREESAAAHSERNVISVGASLKISVPNDSPSSVRRVKGL
jgi:hypothetical protein